ncbi:MAG: dihydrolipoyl dehydrogenase [Oscillospiraceae bacterium]|nr:dihydrolipoyl dehydrogenase [Oscillospiraceae bacterium]
MYDYDVVSIGGGPGGSAAAMRSADRGKKAAVIEARAKNGSGGTCVNRGCIPTKALMASANLYASIKNAKAYGINVDMSAVSVDFKAINRRKNGVINNLGFGLETFLWKKSRGIDVIKGRARLLDAHTVEVDDGREKKTVTAENIVVAVGSEPAELPAFHIDHERIITSNEIMDFSRPMPKDIVIVGSGAIGLEYGHILNIYGVKVTIVEMMENLVPALHEPEITDRVRKSLEKRGITVKTGSGIAGIEVQEDGLVRSTLSSGEELVSEQVLVAIGRTLNTRGLGLEELGVEMERNGQIKTDAHMRTSVPNIFAAGDITVGTQLSDKAQRQGLVIAETIAGNDYYINYDAIPSTLFMEPEIGMVGLTQSEAEEKGVKVITGSLDFSSNEKAIAIGKTEGVIKVVAREADHVIIGAQIFGPEACDLIAELTVAVENGMTLEQVYNSIHPHPTLTEIVLEVCKRAVGLSFDRG